MIGRDEVNGGQDESGVVYFDLPSVPGTSPRRSTRPSFSRCIGQALLLPLQRLRRSLTIGRLRYGCLDGFEAAVGQSDWPGFPKSAAQECESICRRAKKQGIDCVCPGCGGRSGGCVQQGYGEVDVYEAIAAVQKKFAIDRTASA